MKTITPKQEITCEMGQRRDFTELDIRKLNTLYQCQGYLGVEGVIPETEPETPWARPDCVDNTDQCPGTNMSSN